MNRSQSLDSGPRIFGSRSYSIAVLEESQVGEARRLAKDLVLNLGFHEAELGKLAILVTESARNLVRHASNGELVLRCLEYEAIPGIEIIALDKGPGITNFAECLRDGHSTSGGAGTGLGAIKRLSSTFDIYSIAGMGTALLSHLFAKPLDKSSRFGPLQIGAVSLPKPGERVNGDGWSVAQARDRDVILLVDGMGHGKEAEEASVEALRVFQKSFHLSPKAILESIHAQLRGTRGAAAAVAEVDMSCQIVRYAGVGNIAGVILSQGGIRNLVSYNGTLGHEVYKIQEFTYPFPATGDSPSLIVMYSDGVSGKWVLENYPGLAGKHPSLVSGVLYRDHNRGRDDVTVIVGRNEGMFPD